MRIIAMIMATGFLMPFMFILWLFGWVCEKLFPWKEMYGTDRDIESTEDNYK